MIGLVIFFYFIAKYYMQLASDYDKKPLGYIALGVVAFYGSSFLYTFVVSILLEAMNSRWLYSSRVLLSLSSIPFGIAGCWGVYYMLKQKWKREVQSYSKDSNLLDDEM